MVGEKPEGNQGIVSVNLRAQSEMSATAWARQKKKLESWWGQQGPRMGGLGSLLPRSRVALALPGGVGGGWVTRQERMEGGQGGTQKFAPVGKRPILSPHCESQLTRRAHSDEERPVVGEPSGAMAP